MKIGKISQSKHKLLLRLYLQKRQENVKNNTQMTNKKPKYDILTVYLVTDYKIELLENLTFCIVIFNKTISVLCKTRSFATLIASDSLFFPCNENTLVCSLYEIANGCCCQTSYNLVPSSYQVLSSDVSVCCSYLGWNLPTVDLVVFGQLSH